jgi:hypothetical protein
MIVECNQAVLKCRVELGSVVCWVALYVLVEADWNLVRQLQEMSARWKKI